MCKKSLPGFPYKFGDTSQTARVDPNFDVSYLGNGSSFLIGVHNPLKLHKRFQCSLLFTEASPKPGGAKRGTPPPTPNVSSLCYKKPLYKKPGLRRLKFLETFKFKKIQLRDIVSLYS